MAYPPRFVLASVARRRSTDGIDVDSSSAVEIANSDIDRNDDAVVLKAGRDADGLRVNRPTEDVTIHDITVRGGAAGITFESETSGGIRPGNASRIHVLPPVPTGILFKSAPPEAARSRTSLSTASTCAAQEGFQRRVQLESELQLRANSGGHHQCAGRLRVFAEAVPPEKGSPRLRNVNTSDLRARQSEQAFGVASYANSPLENVTFTNIDIEADRGGSIRGASNWKFVKSSVRTADGSGITVDESRGVTGLAR